MSTSFAAAEALRIVLREEQPAAMADVLLDLERARMTAEDVRGEERLREKTARTQVLLDLERARISAEDVSGEERLCEATARYEERARTHGAIRAVMDEIHGFRHGTGVSLDEIISNGFFAVARAVHR